MEGLDLQRIHTAIVSQNIPIGGIASDDGRTVSRIDFPPEATTDQQAQAWQIARSFQPEDASDITTFRVAMLQDPAYNRITSLVASSTDGMLLISRLEEALSYDVPLWSLVALMFQELIAATPQDNRPTEVEAQQWETIRTQNHIHGFKFETTGEITVDPES